MPQVADSVGTGWELALNKLESAIASPAVDSGTSRSSQG
jgi:hypothetical protein